MSRLSSVFKSGTTLYCALGLFSVVAFWGCGDDSTSGPSSTPEPQGGISSADIPASSADALPSSSDVQTPASSADAAISAPSVETFVGFQTSPGALAIAPDADGFYDMGDVYKAVPTTSKIAFLIRHSKRESSTGTESVLTPIGVEMAQNLGKKLVGDESFYYASTDFVRTRSTCENIAIGRGETAVVETWDAINGGYFYTVPTDTLDAASKRSNGTSPRFIAQWAYGVPFSPAKAATNLNGFFYDLFERGNEFINNVMVANMPNWKRVSILVSHDLLLEPLVVFVSNRTIDLKIYEESNHWVNYLSGIAVIIDETNAVTVLPVRGDSIGWMSPRNETAG